jgi:hypothetical protein
MTDAALEFTKAVCQVFGLDKQVELEVRRATRMVLCVLM